MLTGNETHWKNLDIRFTSKKPQAVFPENTFGNLQFEHFTVNGLTKISSSAFSNQTGQSIEFFSCLNCRLSDQPSEFNVWKSLEPLTNLFFLEIGLDISEIPTDALGQRKRLSVILMTSKYQNLTIKSGAFQNLEDIFLIHINSTEIASIEKEAFKFNIKKTNLTSVLELYNVTLHNDTFKEGAFDGLNKPLNIVLQKANINYFDQKVFEPFFNDREENSVVFERSVLGYSYVDCEDCRNYWLIKQNRTSQVEGAICRRGFSNSLFDKSTRANLEQKCKS